MRLHGHEVVAEHQVDRNGVEQVVIDPDFAQVDELAAIALRQGFGLRDLRWVIRGFLDHGDLELRIAFENSDPSAALRSASDQV